MRKINHFGVPTSIKQEGESYAEEMKLYLTDFTKSPNKIEFLRFEEGSPMPELLQKVAHIAYEVPSLKEAMIDKEVLIEVINMCGRSVTRVKKIRDKKGFSSGTKNCSSCMGNCSW